MAAAQEVERVVLLLGAGATVSDVAKRGRRNRPPLDKGFFRIAQLTHPTLVDQILRYMKTTYDVDIRSPVSDSLEGVMGQIYTDMFNPELQDTATDAFQTLLRLFTRRLGETTNNIEPSNRRHLYRILAGYFASGIDPANLTIITFNQDLQVEKTLCLMSGVDRWGAIKSQLFNFPGCYSIGSPDVTSPTGSGSHELFDEHRFRSDCVRVLKPHGSLNWYSTHISPRPPPSAVFRQNRKLRVTRRKIINPGMTYTGKRKTYALPVVVPPVTHKSAVLHQRLQGVWTRAEEALREADELIIFGYSCPQLDFESSNLLRRTHVGRDGRIVLIDPSPPVAMRYMELLSPQRFSVYPSAAAFLGDQFLR